MTSNVIVSVPSDFPHVQHAQDQCLLTASRTPLIQETGQMRENRVCVVVFPSCADSLIFNVDLTHISRIAFCHQGDIYTAG